MSTTTTVNDRATWLMGPSQTCSHPPAEGVQAWHIVLLGPPGVGKGTQAELLCKHLGSCHLSTGDVFRAAKSLDQTKATPAMADALVFMKQGALVPDPTVVSLVQERRRCLRCCGGFLLDGFPRTAAQAQSLEETINQEHITLDAVINYQLPLDQILTRLTGRRTCPKCKAVYHVQNRPPKIAGQCDQCQTALIQREDDREEAVRQRMTAYNDTMAPLLDFYTQRKLLVVISADGTPDAVLARTLAAITPLKRAKPRS